MKTTWKCSECQQETELNVTPFRRAKTWGPPETCYPSEGGEIEPDTCPCGREIPVDEVIERAMTDDRESAAEARADAIREDGWLLTTKF